MKVNGIFNNYLNCVRSIAYCKTNTFQQNIVALFSCAAPLGVAAALYCCLRGSLFGRFKKGPPPSSPFRTVNGPYGFLYQKVQSELALDQKLMEKTLNELDEVIKKPKFRSDPAGYVLELCAARLQGKKVEISDTLRTLLAKAYDLPGSC